MNTRIAPSPTGSMHMGTARTAYFNWLAAKASGGQFLLRIDDTDLQRNDLSKIDDIFQIMDWLGLDYDLVVKQSDRLERYNQIADQLIQNNFAQISDGAIRLSINNFDDFQKSWVDQIVGSIGIGKEDLDYISNMVLIKSDGSPAYNFASAIDDIDFKIDYVIRGNDHTKNTAKQLFIYYLLQVDIPKYAHLGLLTKDKKKLSKRDGASSMLYYRDAGYDADAMLNFLLRLGWGPKIDDKTTALISKEQALKLFLDGGKMKASAAEVDFQKLDSFDRKYKGRKK